MGVGVDDGKIHGQNLQMANKMP
jgi:hypothetical protein